MRERERQRGSSDRAMVLACVRRWGAPTSSAGKFIVEMDEGGWMHTYHATVYEAPNGQRIQFRTSGAPLLLPAPSCALFCLSDPRPQLTCASTLRCSQR